MEEATDQKFAVETMKRLSEGADEERSAAFVLAIDKIALCYDQMGIFP